MWRTAVLKVTDARNKEKTLAQGSEQSQRRHLLGRLVQDCANLCHNHLVRDIEILEVLSSSSSTSQFDLHVVSGAQNSPCWNCPERLIGKIRYL